MQTRHHDGNSKAHKCNHHLGQFFPASLKTEVVISAPGAAQPSLEDACAATVLRSVARKIVQSAKDGGLFLKLLFGWLDVYFRVHNFLSLSYFLIFNLYKNEMLVALRSFIEFQYSICAMISINDYKCLFIIK